MFEKLCNYLVYKFKFLGKFSVFNPFEVELSCDKFWNFGNYLTSMLSWRHDISYKWQKTVITIITGYFGLEMYFFSRHNCHMAAKVLSFEPSPWKLENEIEGNLILHKTYRIEFRNCLIITPLFLKFITVSFRIHTPRTFLFYFIFLN
jgi:hypothetical protein